MEVPLNFRDSIVFIAEVERRIAVYSEPEMIARECSDWAFCTLAIVRFRQEKFGLLLVGPPGTLVACEFRAEWSICLCNEASRELGWSDPIHKELHRIRLNEQNERKFLRLIRTFLDALAACRDAARVTEEALLAFARVIPSELSLAGDVEITSEGKVIEALG